MTKPDLGDIKVLIWDNGLFVHTAAKLAESFGEVFYGGNYVNAFPKSNATLPGDGLDGVTRVLDFWDHVHDCDLVVFPDVGYADIQTECVRQGKRVWGARQGENLEMNRWQTKQLFKRLGMPVTETHLIEGMAALRRFLQEREGHWWIKTSRYRGDFETFDSEDYEDVEPKLSELEYSLGRKAIAYPFNVERHIDAVLEIGYDGDTVDGKFPADDQPSLFGIERKDLGYVGIAKLYGELPDQVRWVNSKLSETLAKYQYRGWWSTEIRCTPDEQDGPPKSFEDCPVIWNQGEKCGDFYAHFTDPCCRCASPPSEAYIEWITNWAEKIWKGATGTYVPNEIESKYAIEIMLHSGWADKGWQPVRFPEEIDRWVKLRNMCRIDGVYSAVPQCYGLPEIGAVVGLDDDFSTAIKLALERAKAINGYFIEPKVNAVNETIAEIRAAQEQGIEFTDDPLPTADEITELASA